MHWFLLKSSNLVNHTRSVESVGLKSNSTHISIRFTIWVWRLKLWEILHVGIFQWELRFSFDWKRRESIKQIHVSKCKNVGIVLLWKTTRPWSHGVSSHQKFLIHAPKWHCSPWKGLNWTELVKWFTKKWLQFFSLSRVPLFS